MENLLRRGERVCVRQHAGGRVLDGLRSWGIVVFV